MGWAILFIVAAIVIGIVKYKAEKAVSRGINRAVRRGTVAREKELTGEVLTATVATTSISTVRDAIDEVLDFRKGSLPLVGAVFHLVSSGPEAFTMSYGNKMSDAFVVAVVVQQDDDETSTVSYTVTQWLQLDGVSESTKMMESARSAFVHVAASMPGARQVVRTLEGSDTVLWSAIGTPEVTSGDASISAPEGAQGLVPSADAVDTIPPRADVHLGQATIAEPGAQEGVMPLVDVVEVPLDDDLDMTRQAPPSRAVLRGDDGTEIDIAGGVVIGRAPASQGAARAVAVSDESFSLSKTHLAIEPGPAGLTVTDLYSTNGVVLVRDGADSSLAAGVPEPVRAGDRLVIGERSFTLAQIR
ncbi:FHA domain-containing protein [Demequina sp. NBRC 110054]|uniref:FHA domain-containing protein n=1 Tax=Demequina sp. NBRC 110054 TaxID=1570343 RepID=UPI000A04170C|nr:FHA domain-containing protein [Demequina sp. NBRC 110054]